MLGCVGMGMGVHVDNPTFAVQASCPLFFAGKFSAIIVQMCGLKV
jgi:hypothetical protein